MRLGQFLPFSLADTDSIGCSIFFQGCSKRCKGCHNPQLQPFDGGEEITVKALADRIKKNSDWYNSVALIGGEPLDQPKSLFLLLKEIKSLNLEAWLYTGYEVAEIPKNILDLCDVVIAGEYREDLPNPDKFPASTNQIVLDRRERVNGYTSKHNCS
jgi:anaerobic ribonucleoside-triphosphate reductase activating protein